MSLPANNYCERISEAFWAEPINALTNGLFFLAAIAVYSLIKKHKLNGLYRVLPYELAIVGVGSFLWHTARSPITQVLDGSLLYIFILTVLVLLLKQLSGKWNIAWFGLIGLVLFQVAVFIFVPALRDTPIRHIIALTTFILLSLWIKKKTGVLPKNLLIAIASYITAIVAKGVDLSVCNVFPIGTHFLWHALGAMAGYFSVKTLIDIKQKLEG